MMESTANPVPFFNSAVLSPNNPKASGCAMAGFTTKPSTHCLLTFYFEPVHRRLHFALENTCFTLIGKLGEIKGDRLRLDLSEARVNDSVTQDMCYAVRLGLMSLLVYADRYFPNKATQALLCNNSCPPLIQLAVPSFKETKGWLSLPQLEFDNPHGEWFLGHTVPLLEGLDVRAFIAAYFEGSLKAMQTLEAGGHWRDLFVLLQCSIDHLAWLARPEGQEMVTRSDFCRWVHQHLRLSGNVPLTAGEVYAWRCQWVHTYGGQAPQGNPLTLADQLPTDYQKEESQTLVGVKNVLRRYQEALTVFAIHCSLDAELRERVNKRLAEMPTAMSVESASIEGSSFKPT
jgi:hypothetical protein